MLATAFVHVSQQIWKIQDFFLPFLLAFSFHIIIRRLRQGLAGDSHCGFLISDFFLVSFEPQHVRDALGSNEEEI